MTITRSARWGLVILGLLALAGVVYVLKTSAEIRRIDEIFSRIERGDSETRVRALMGEPWKVETKTLFFSEDIWWDARKDPAISKRCVKEYVYKKSLPILSVLWVVGFDADDHAIARHRLD